MTDLHALQERTSDLLEQIQQSQPIDTEAHQDNLEAAVDILDDTLRMLCTLVDKQPIVRSNVEPVTQYEVDAAINPPASKPRIVAVAKLGKDASLDVTNVMGCVHEALREVQTHDLAGPIKLGFTLHLSDDTPFAVKAYAPVRKPDGP